MVSNYPKLPLEKVISIHDSKRKPIKKGDRISGPYPYYGASDIADYINDYVFDGTYLLLSEDGDNLRTRKTPIAFLAKGKFWVNNHAHVLQGEDELDTQFFCYALQYAEVDNYISGSTRPKITQADLKKIPVSAPPITTRREIAAFVKSLDDKITLNRQINQTLEQMAQTLFKSWFVDFDPVIDNALDAGNPIPDELQHRAEARKTILESEGFKPLPDDVRQLFPDAFEESELGWVPKGWGVAALSTLAEVIMGQSPKGDTYNDDGIGTALVNGPVEFGEYHPVKTKWTSAPSKFSQPSDLIVCVRGSTTGRYVISDDIYCLGRGVCSIRGGHIQPFITYLFKQQIPALLGMATGSTFPSWSGPTLKNCKVIKPSSDVISRYCEIVGTNLQKMALLDSEIQSLKNLRDTLLPKLISGELRLDDAEAAVEQETVSA